jgi:hypothetical protein
VERFSRHRLCHRRRRQVLDSPRYAPAMTVDGAYDETFLTYYGIRWMKK